MTNLKLKNSYNDKLYVRLWQTQFSKNLQLQTETHLLYTALALITLTLGVNRII